MSSCCGSIELLLDWLDYDPKSSRSQCATHKQTAKMCDYLQESMLTLEEFLEELPSEEMLRPPPQHTMMEVESVDFLESNSEESFWEALDEDSSYVIILK